MSTVDIIIPTYKPDIALLRMIDDLERQALRPSKIIIMNTEEKYWDDLLSKSRENPQEKYDNIVVEHLTKADSPS